MKAIKINNLDNVAVALQDLQVGTDILGVKLSQNIARGHKFALIDIANGQNVVKYGFAIGHALSDIKQGEHIHTHNLKTNLNDILAYQYQPLQIKLEQAKDLPIEIYRRANGQVGIRNELWIIPTVGCVNAIGENLIKQFKQKNHFDDIHIFTHQFGCSQLGDDHNNTKTFLQNMVMHPNVGGVLVLGLGCENNQIKDFKINLTFDEKRVKFLTIQEVSDEMQAGLSLLDEIYSQMKDEKRTVGKLSEISFGLECGGSDGLSGITANPLQGMFADYINAIGGTTVLTEVPEMFGAEQILMNRACNQAVFEKTVAMINDFKQYFIDLKQPIYENPSPGNKTGGITTLEDKSLGCTQKAGQATVMDVLNYGQRLTQKGLNLLSSPGNDAVATSALAGCGCHLVLFSTGRGTPYGGFVPTVKIASNHELAMKKPHWIDFDASILLSEQPQTILAEFLNFIIEVINGKAVKNEINNFREIAIFKNGVTL